MQRIFTSQEALDAALISNPGLFAKGETGVVAGSQKIVIQIGDQTFDEAVISSITRLEQAGSL